MKPAQTSALQLLNSKSGSMIPSSRIIIIAIAQGRRTTTKNAKLIYHAVVSLVE